MFRIIISFPAHRRQQHALAHGDFGGVGWACLLAVGLIHSALAYVLYFSSLRALPGQEAAILSYVDPLVAVVLSLTVLREPVAPVQLVGGALILAFTLANELKAREG